MSFSAQNFTNAESAHQIRLPVTKSNRPHASSCFLNQREFDIIQSPWYPRGSDVEIAASPLNYKTFAIKSRENVDDDIQQMLGRIRHQFGHSDMDQTVQFILTHTPKELALSGFMRVPYSPVLWTSCVRFAQKVLCDMSSFVSRDAIQFHVSPTPQTWTIMHVEEIVQVNFGFHAEEEHVYAIFLLLDPTSMIERKVEVVFSRKASDENKIYITWMVLLTGSTTEIPLETRPFNTQTKHKQ